MPSRSTQPNSSDRSGSTTSTRAGKFGVHGGGAQDLPRGGQFAGQGHLPVPGDRGSDVAQRATRQRLDLGDSILDRSTSARAAARLRLAEMISKKAEHGESDQQDGNPAAPVDAVGPTHDRREERADHRQDKDCDWRPTHPGRDRQYSDVHAEHERVFLAKHSATVKATQAR